MAGGSGRRCPPAADAIKIRSRQISKQKEKEVWIPLAADALGDVLAAGSAADRAIGGMGDTDIWREHHHVTHARCNSGVLRATEEVSLARMGPGLTESAATASWKAKPHMAFVLSCRKCGAVRRDRRVKGSWDVSDVLSMIFDGESAACRARCVAGSGRSGKAQGPGELVDWRRICRRMGRFPLSREAQLPCTRAQVLPPWSAHFSSLCVALRRDA